MTIKTFFFFFFERCSWFKFNNLGLTRGMNLKLYTSDAKGLKSIFPTSVEVTGKKQLGEGAFFAHQHPEMSIKLYKLTNLHNKSFS